MRKLNTPQPILKPEPLSSQQAAHLSSLRDTLQTLQAAPRPVAVMAS